MSNRNFNIWHWVLNLLLSFLIAAILIIVISGRSRVSNHKAYLIRLIAALIIAIVMGLLVDSPRTGNHHGISCDGFTVSLFVKLNYERSGGPSWWHNYVVSIKDQPPLQ